MCNKNMLTITEKNWTTNKIHNLSCGVAVSTSFLPDSLIKCVSIIKQIVGFQRCFGATSGPGEVQDKDLPMTYTFSGSMFHIASHTSDK